MQTTLPMPVAPVEPSDPKILVRVVANTISDAALEQLREVSTSQDRASDCLRNWLRGCVDAEIARRAVEAGILEEPRAWMLPWHEWDDRQLATCLAATYSWFDVADNQSAAMVLREVHRAVLTACATRLQELHQAIENSQRNHDV